jgi:hypothetical protein
MLDVVKLHVSALIVRMSSIPASPYRTELQIFEHEPQTLYFLEEPLVLT